MTLNRITGKWLFVLGLLALSAHGIWGEDLNSSPFQPPDPNYVPDDSAKHISVWEVNEFHLHLINDVLYQLPDQGDLTLQYCGILVDHGKRWGKRVSWNGDPLEWQVCGELVVFSIRLSIHEAGSHGSWKIGDRTLYLQVSFVDGFGPVTEEALDAPHDDLGGMSVREFVKLIEEPVKVKAPRKPGAPAPVPAQGPAPSPAKTRRR